MDYILIKYLHFLGIGFTLSALVLEHALLKEKLEPAELKRLANIDLVYGISAGVVLGAGLALWLSVGKGSDFYSGNSLFLIKLALFGVIGLLSIYPTIFFVKNRKSETSLDVPSNIRVTIRAELFLLILLPLLAVLMAQGASL